jgi:uncharacterized protein with FMN-binding domain
MAKKMPGRLVALSASAVAAIYIAGLLSTQTAAQSVTEAVAAPPPTPSSAAANPSTTSTTPSASAPTVVVGASATATATATPTTATSPASTYSDGTYSATGTSPLGNVTVSVSLSSDRITNVQITKVTTKFPVSRIASLPAQVIQGQTASVNVVTGATYSSQAFRQAVQLALQQARAVNTTTVAA